MFKVRLGGQVMVGGGGCVKVTLSICAPPGRSVAAPVTVNAIVSVGGGLSRVVWKSSQSAEFP